MGSGFFGLLRTSRRTANGARTLHFCYTLLVYQVVGCSWPSRRGSRNARQSEAAWVGLEKRPTRPNEWHNCNWASVSHRPFRQGPHRGCVVSWPRLGIFTRLPFLCARQLVLGAFLRLEGPASSWPRAPLQNHVARLSCATTSTSNGNAHLNIG